MNKEAGILIILGGIGTIIVGGILLWWNNISFETPYTSIIVMVAALMVFIGIILGIALVLSGFFIYFDGNEAKNPEVLE